MQRINLLQNQIVCLKRFKCRPSTLYTIVFERDAHYSYHDNRFFVAKRTSKVQNVGFVIKKGGKKEMNVGTGWHVGHVDGQLDRYCEYGHAWSGHTAFVANPLPRIQNDIRMYERMQVSEMQ